MSSIADVNCSVFYSVLHTTHDMTPYLRGWDGRISSITCVAFTTWGQLQGGPPHIMDLAWSKVNLRTNSVGARDAQSDTTRLRVSEHSALVVAESHWIEAVAAVRFRSSDLLASLTHDVSFAARPMMCRRRHSPKMLVGKNYAAPWKTF